MEAARMQILEAIEAGKITAHEAARLLDALGGRPPEGEKTIRMRVVDTGADRTRVDVTLALPVLEAFAALGLNPGELWGVSGMPSAETLLAAARAGTGGQVAEAEDEQGNVRVERSVEQAVEDGEVVGHLPRGNLLAVVLDFQLLGLQETLIGVLA